MTILRARFVRIAGQKDRVYVVRPDGSEVSWSFPTYGDQLPHDLVHLIVESAAGLAAGFWGRVAAGVDPARVNALANAAAGKLETKYAGFGGDLGELLIAEALAAYPWRAGADERAAWAEHAGAGIDPPDDALVLRVAELLDAQTGRWRTLVPKGVIEAVFDPSDPRRGLSRWV